MIACSAGAELKNQGSAVPEGQDDSSLAIYCQEKRAKGSRPVGTV